MIQFRRTVSPITVVENIAVSHGIREFKRLLDLRKIYRVLPPEGNDPKDYVRVVDESGEDYLYHKKGFELIDLPQRTERKLLATLR